MEIIIILLTILFNIALSLGVGSSTLAIVNFFVAIADGKINPDERRMMGVVYIVLRISMVLLLITSLLLVSLNVQLDGPVSYSSLMIATWILLLVLYLNAILMTLRIMPSSFGPSIQAGTWYTFGIITTLSTLGIVFTVTNFVLFYISFVLVVTIVVNGIMLYFQSNNKNNSKKSNS